MQIKKTALENLLYESGLTQIEFAKKVNVNITTFRAQLKQKKVVDLAIKYAKILNVNRVKGYTEEKCYIELVIMCGSLKVC